MDSLGHKTDEDTDVRFGKVNCPQVMYFGVEGGSIIQSCVEKGTRSHSQLGKILREQNFIMRFVSEAHDTLKYT